MNEYQFKGEATDLLYAAGWCFRRTALFPFWINFANAKIEFLYSAALKSPATINWLEYTKEGKEYAKLNPASRAIIRDAQRGIVECNY